MNTRFECLAALSLVIILSAVVGCGSGGNADKDAGVGKSAAAANSEGAENGGSADDAKPVKTEPKVAIETNLGTITVRLNADKAYLTVQNFLQYVDDKYYDGTIFHDVTKGYAVLGGGYTKDMAQKQERSPVRNEAHNGLKNVRGTIAMVRKPDVIDSATSQFMFNLSDNDFLDHKGDSNSADYGYCVFGEVIEGMDVLDKIGAQAVKEVPVTNGEPFPRVPVETVMIRSIRRVR